MFFVRAYVLPQLRWFRRSGVTAGNALRPMTDRPGATGAGLESPSLDVVGRQDNVEREEVSSASTPLNQAASADGALAAPGMPTKQRLLVVGNGMVAQHFCEALHDSGLLERFEIVVFGEEPQPAYDRVQLGKAFQLRDTSSLLLKPHEWYGRLGIVLHTDTRVARISREDAVVETEQGDLFPFDKLVLATGSSAVVPKGLEVEGDHVRVYRTLQDVKWIRERALSARSRGLPVLVIGGGLLGLELAECLNELGLHVVVLEASEYLLPRQLDQQTAEFVAKAWQRDIAELHVGARLRSLRTQNDEVVAELSDDSTLVAAFCVIAAGVRPRDELARQAGLTCDLFGGIEVNDHLESSDPRIFAIGECARHRGKTYGLVAPGYDMARALVQRLGGEGGRFDGAPLATKLKSSRVKLSVYGQSAENNPSAAPLIVQRGGALRRIVVDGERITAATLVGEWEEANTLQQVIARNLRFTDRQQRRFTEGKRVWSKAVVSLRTWPDEAIVCACTGVTCKTLKLACEHGQRTALELQQKTGAGTVCGSCRPLIASLLGDPVMTTQAVKTKVLFAALFAFLAACVTLLARPIPLVDTAQARFNYDVLWRDSFTKQLSGYSLLLVFIVTGLGFSLRKRWRKFHFGGFDGWRLSHVVLGGTCLVGAFVHTGFRLGVNLDRVLMLLFVGSALLGAVAATVVAVEGKLSAHYAAALRRFWTRVHLYLLWPLPVLILIHVLKVYYF